MNDPRVGDPVVTSKRFRGMIRRRFPRTLSQDLDDCVQSMWEAALLKNDFGTAPWSAMMDFHRRKWWGKNRDKPTAVASDIVQWSPDPTSSSRYDQAEQRIDLEIALRGASEERRLAVAMRLEGLTYEEIGEMLDKSASGAYRLITGRMG